MESDLNKYKSELIDCKQKLESLRVANRYKYLSGGKEIENIQFKSLINEIRQLIEIGITNIEENHEYAERNVKSILEKLHKRIKDLDNFTKGDENSKNIYNGNFYF